MCVYAWLHVCVEGRESFSMSCVSLYARVSFGSGKARNVQVKSSEVAEI